MIDECDFALASDRETKVECITRTGNEGKNNSGTKRDEADNYRRRQKDGANEEPREWLCSVSPVDEVKLKRQSNGKSAPAQEKREEVREMDASLPHRPTRQRERKSAGAMS